MGGGVQISQLINLRVAALLASGQPHDALIDWHAGYRHGRVFQRQPTLLACMLRVMLTALSTDSVRRGLIAHAWSEDELSAISNDLATIDLMSDCAFGMSSERAFFNNTLDLVKTNPRMWTAINSTNPAKLPEWSWDMLIPRGWFAQNQIHMNEWYDREIAGIDAEKDHSTVEIQLPNFDRPQDWVRFPYWFVVSSATFLLGGNIDLCRETQMNVDLSLVACALERFRVRYGNYPKQLHELLPGMLPKLPRDRFDGQALRYRRTDEGGVMLYSIGKDRRDDGGDNDKDCVLRLTPGTPKPGSQ
jgi:hypothetical protein